MVTADKPEAQLGDGYFALMVASQARGGGGGGGGGGYSHRRRVQSCDRGQDAVKRSRHFLGVGQTVKQCAGHYLRHYWQSRGEAGPFAHAHLIDGQGSRANIQRGQAVKAVFRRSKILTPVAALDTGPMGVTPPCQGAVHRIM